MIVRTTTIGIATLALVSLAHLACDEGGDAEQGSATTAQASAQEPAGKTVRISVGASSYDPASVSAKVGEPLTLIFRRTTDEGCGHKLVIPSQNIEKDLPLNQDVEVTFTPREAGNLRFTCGMDMFDGSIVVQ
jgi:plastocyanin domain-containing protein